MWSPRRRVKACRQQGLPSPVWYLFTTVWVGLARMGSSSQTVEHSLSLNTLGEQNKTEPVK